jgi:hypothetical protein
VAKLVAAFVFFLGASALAIHESKPPPPPREIARAEPTAIDHTPPSRAVHDETPPWVKYAPAPAPPAPPPVITRTIEVKPRVFVTESEIEIVDVVDRCPDQPTSRDDEDGCPEPVNQLEDRIILVE